MANYLIGTGGWAYFRVPNKPSLNLYSKVFNFVEVNYTFYEYPDMRRVNYWRKTVPGNFMFSVRCNQDLTHRIGLRPLDEAYYILGRMMSYCEALDAPFLVLETPTRYAFNQQEVENARDFFFSANLNGVRLVWEIRAPVTPALINLMQDFNIVNCVDLSKKKPCFHSDVVYSRLFGKGKHNLYQFTDEELVEIDKNAQSSHKVIVLSYHSARMFADAARFLLYKNTGKFFPVTSFFGIDSAKAVLKEDSVFPATKAELIKSQGWKVVDLSFDKRVHLSEILYKIPEKTYYGVDELIKELKIK